MKKYILLYGDKKQEDNICIKNMFKNNRQINLGWTDFDNNNNVKIVEEIISQDIEQIIFSGFEIGWDKLIKNIKNKFPDVIVKVICNTQDSLLYYEYERNNFFKLLQFSKENIIDDIAFLRKGQYEVYKNLGYKCSYLMQNYILDKKYIKSVKEKNDIVDIGIYPLNYVWDKNIFNQLCIPKFIENSNLNYNRLDERMEDFLKTMQIKSKVSKIEKIEEKYIVEELIKNDIIVSASFTEYMHPIFWISMELGIPCIIGNTSDLFEEDEELKQYIVSNAEDNAIENAKIVNKYLDNKEKILELCKNWKEKYNKRAEENIQAFLEK